MYSSLKKWGLLLFKNNKDSNSEHNPFKFPIRISFAHGPLAAWKKAAEAMGIPDERAADED